MEITENNQSYLVKYTNASEWNLNEAKFESDNNIDPFKRSYWTGHRPFIYDLIAFLKPQKVVELGSHYGVSLFAMAQAIKDFNLQTELYGVDRWVEHPKTEYIGQQIFDLISEVKSKYFSSTNLSLLRMDFLSASKKFENESLDLIHIDGDHAYESVRDDYNLWIQKLKPNGIILFHDIAPYAQEGSVRFWNEIKAKYTHFEFWNSGGLGVLFPKGANLFMKLLQNNFYDKILMYEYRSNTEYLMRKNIMWQEEQTNMWWQKYDKLEKEGVSK